MCNVTYMKQEHIHSLQKLDNRKSVLERTNALSDELKEKWRQVLNPVFISSEESGEEEVDGDVRQFLFVKPLPWRDAKVKKFRKQMD